MDGFELRMSKADLHEKRESILVVKEALESAHVLGDLLRGRRNERRLVQSASRRADPILTPTQLTWSEVRPPDTLEKLLVDLADERHTHGQLTKPRQAVVHRMEELYDLVHVPRSIRCEYLRFRSEHVLQRTLRALDLARQDCLFPDVHEDEEVRVR